MIELRARMSERELAAVSALEERTVRADGGRLKLEWGVLRSRSGSETEDILYWDGDLLVGFLGIYAFGPPTVELAGMVDPAARRRGIATSLLAAALPLCRDRGYSHALLVTPRTTEAGAAFALARGARLEHCEHALRLDATPAPGAEDPRVALRAAGREDVAAIGALLNAGFGSAPDDLAERLERPGDSTYVITFNSAPVGTVRVSRDADSAGVYGFVVHPDWQRQGIGRDVLGRICRQLRAQRVDRIGLEVAVENEHALGLYTSLGFRRISTEDYYEVAL